MQNNIKWPLLACSFFLVVGMAILFENESPNLPVQAETSYTISLDSTNAPALSSSEFVSGTLDLPQKAVQMEYTGAKNVPGNHVELEYGGSISNAASTQITTIKRIDIDFSGSAYIAVSLGWNSDLPRVGALYEPGVPIISDQECYYFVISGDGSNTTIHSVLITYSCVPTPPRPDYTLSGDGTHYIVCGYRKSPTNLVIESTHNGLPVTEIAPEAFRYKVLTSVFIPASITTIGNQAFYGSSVGTVTFAPLSQVLTIGKEAFAYCTQLTTVTLPQSLVGLETAAFKGCTKITSMSFPTSLLDIGDEAFSGCTSLSSVSLNEGLISIGNSAFAECLFSSLTLPSTLRYIGSYALSSLPLLTSIEIPSAVQTIEDYAFFQSRSLATVTLVDTVTSPSQLAFLGEGVFIYTAFMDSLYEEALSLDLPYVRFQDFVLVGMHMEGNIVLEDDIRGITPYAFSGSNISGFSTQSSASMLTYIGESAFMFCTSLVNVTLPTGLEYVGKDAFKETSFLNSARDAADLANVPLILNDHFLIDGSFLNGDVFVPEGVTDISYRAFYGATGITSLSLPSTLKVIDEEAFYQSVCVGNLTLSANNLEFVGPRAFFESSTLTSIDLSSSKITTLEESTFKGCYELVSITLPVGLQDIGNYAFYGCTKLVNCNFPEALQTIGDYAFTSTDVGGAGLNFAENLKTIGKESFKNCLFLSSLSFSANSQLSEIKSSAFFGCTTLAEISFLGSSDVLFLRESAFYNCSSLTSVVLPDSLYSIGDTVFGNCIDLTSIILPANIAHITNGPFVGCTSLTVIQCKANEKPYGWNALNWNADNVPVVWGYSETK